MADQQDVIAFLSNPGSYGLPAGAVTRHETHGSIVFLAGERAYKLKRAVKYAYLDYSTPAKRRAMCEAELAVNRRTAPELYLAVRAIARSGNGPLRFADADDAGALDYVLVMRRFDQACLLEEMRKAGRLTPPLMRALAEAIAEFHRRAETAPRFGGRDGIARVIAENGEVLVGMIAAPFAAARVAQWRTDVQAALARLGGALERRRETGHVRRCHGDLHLNNICLIDGKPVLFDAIEFEDDFASIDTFYDLAFLLMDLDRHGLRAFANIVMNRYLERTLDFAGVEVLPLFLSCRAAIRAHVSVTTAKRTAYGADALMEDAVRLLGLAISYLQPQRARLVAMGGISGTGKSTVARALAPALGMAPGAVILRSDVLRKQIVGIAEDARLDQAGYTEAVNARVYARMRALAVAVLRSGYCVIADAVHGRADERDAIAAAARESGAAFTGLWLDAPAPTLERRIVGRTERTSDATVEVMHKQRSFVTVPRDWAKIDAGGDTDETIARARAALGENHG